MLSFILALVLAPAPAQIAPPSGGGGGAGLSGYDDSGERQGIAVTDEGHAEVEIHGPLLPFGSVHTESLTPIYQSTAVYGINTIEHRVTTGNAASPAGATSATVAAANNLFTASTGSTAYAFGTLQSRRRLAYRPGQGFIGRFTAKWSAPAASSIVVAGFGTGESGLYFGYNGTSFGVLHSTGGVREIQTLTVTTASTATNDAQVTLAGVSYTCAGITSGTATLTAYQLSKCTYAGWDAMAVGATVVFVAQSVGNKTGAFSIAQSGAGTPIAGTYAETLAGVASTDTWIAQADWNGDKLDGTGSSGVTLDPAKGNVFEIQAQYLGYGSLTFKAEVASAGNNPTWVTVHTIRSPNSRTAVTLTQPNFPFTMAAYSAGSTTDVSVSVGSYAGFIEGKHVNIGPRISYEATSTAATAGSRRALFTIRNDLTCRGRTNQSVIHLISMGGAMEDTTPVTIYLLRNATLAGTPSFASTSTNSCASVDTAATTATVAVQEQIIQTIPLGASGSEFVQWNGYDEITVQPGETITLAAQTVTGTAAYVLGMLNTREDQ